MDSARLGGVEKGGRGEGEKRRARRSCVMGTPEAARGGGGMQGGSQAGRGRGGDRKARDGRGKAGRGQGWEWALGLGGRTWRELAKDQNDGEAKQEGGRYAARWRGVGEMRLPRPVDLHVNLAPP